MTTDMFRRIHSNKKKNYGQNEYEVLMLKIAFSRKNGCGFVRDKSARSLTYKRAVN